jgi:hypothetical protein
MFVFPFYISLFFFLLGLCQIMGAFSDLKKAVFWYEKATQREFQIEHCASIKATSLNLENAYLYLIRSLPEKKENFHQIKIRYQNFLEPFLREENCTGEPLFSLKALPYQERNKKLPRFWPNWAIHYE